VNKQKIADRLGRHIIVSNYAAYSMIDVVDDLIEEAATTERHRIYAALEADPSALWRDQGFQEWRRKRGENTDS
jgi:hypothetical protein